MSFSTYNSETIAAISTAKGNAALAIIRVSGSSTIEVVSKISDKSIHPIAFNKIKRTNFYNNGELLDEGMVTFFQAPNSYTGEDMAELYCHGNNFIVSQILESLLVYCRLANNGEFTLRRFLNKKIDLTQAEAIGDILAADTKQTQKAALLQLKGKLYNKIRLILDKITNLRTIIELAIDFVEDEVPEYNSSFILLKIEEILEDMNRLILTGQEGIVLRDGLKVCLVGEPNVGKSSIFNALLSAERSIVTPIPGTTRDYIEEIVSLSGYKIRLFDTAGIRESGDIIEKLGIERTEKIIDEADLILYIHDATALETGQFDNKILPDCNIPVIHVLNKIDLLSDINISYAAGRICCSALTEHGLDGLKEGILSIFQNIESEMENGIITNSRQLACLKKANEAMLKAKAALQNEMGADFVAFDILEASNAVEEIIGRVSSEDILNRIFSNYCIGK